MNTLLLRIEATLKKYRMLHPGERLLVASSGGADSVALFHLLKELTLRFPLRLSLLHFDHALRKKSAQDFEFVRSLAKKFNIPFYGGRAKKATDRSKKGFSPEEKARELRYEFFGKIARKTKIRKIALAHHKDDQAETVLMRFLQGTGPRGLQGIRPVVKNGGVTFIRPLGDVTRIELREFLRKNRIPYREDETNRSPRFLRNRIRHRLLPLLEKEFNPKVRDLLSRLAESIRSELEGLDEWVQKKWRAFLRTKTNGGVRFDRALFLLLPEALQFRLLDQVLHAVDPRSGLDFESWQKFKGGLQRGHFRITLPRKIDLTLTSKTLSLQRLK